MDSDLPEIECLNRPHGNQAEVDLVVPANLIALDGHFPGSPIVPGYMLVGWATRFASSALGARTSISSARAVKFLRPVTPGDRLRLTLRRDAGQEGEDVVHFEYRSVSPDSRMAHGILTLRSFE
jgi:3-hydroxymyristoyl/3-hydroxydecanoyl-(acyl carrier protein) dehydratase